jgi:hypothetical protein
VPKKDLPEAKMKEMKGILENNLKVSLGRRFGTVAPQKFTKQQVLDIINKNAQIKQMITAQPEQFIEMIPTNPSLQQLFKDVDPYEVIEELTGKKLKKKKAKKKEKADEKVDETELLEELGSEKKTKKKSTKKKSTKKKTKKKKKEEEEDEDDESEGTDLDLISKLL